MKQETTKDRVKVLLEDLRITQKAFEDAVGLANGWCNKVGFNIREDILRRISKAYPELNLDWLRFGQGSMWKGEKEDPGVSTQEVKSQPSSQKAAKRGDKPTITYLPLVPISAQGGSLNDFDASVRKSECEMIVSPITGADFAITVSGDSMAPEYPNGSHVFVKKINERAFIDWGKAYVLDTCNGKVIKILTPSDQGEGFVKCISLNEDPKFAPFDVCLKDVYGIYRVMLCMSVK